MDARWTRASLLRAADDMIFRNGGRRSLLSLRRSGSEYVGSIRMGVRR